MPSSLNAPSPHDHRPARWPVWLCLILAALAGLYWWWQIGRPVPLADASSTRIACVSYAPFRLPGETPFDLNAVVSPARIDADMRALLQRFDCVRTYSQGHGLNALPAIAGRYGMKVLMGIWLSSDPVANAEEMRLGIATARANPQVLRGVIVGNEVLLRGELSEEALGGYIRTVRSEVHVPVTYADVWEFWLRHPQLAGSVDYLTIHILPYWEDDPVPPKHAVQHVAEVYARVQQAFAGKRVMIGETGWPSRGRMRRQADATLVNETRYMREFLSYAATVDMPYNVIEAFDQPWKREQEGTAGGYWGIFDSQAQPKFAMQGPVVEEPHWWLGWLAGGVGTLLFVLAGAWRLRRPEIGHSRWRHALALGVAGIASGTALAWQARQLIFACRTPWEWTLAIGICVCALLTGLRLTRSLAAWLAGGAMKMPSSRWRWLRGSWLFGLAFYDILMVWDGRYRDFPLGVFALPCVGYALAGCAAGWRTTTVPSLEERFLAGAVALLGAAVVLQEAGLNPVAWVWFVLNLAIALPVWLGWVRLRHFSAHHLHAKQA